MDIRRTPSSTQFVAYFEDRDAARRQIAKIPDCEGLRPLEHDESVQLVSISSSTTRNDPRRAWEVIQAALPEAVVAPVLVDPHGNSLYPTGTIRIRFVEPPSDEELDALAREHRLTHVLRNRYQPAQVSCRPDDPTSRYLPDVVDKVGTWPGAKAAWAETRALYERL